MSQRLLTLGSFMPFQMLIKGRSVYIDKTAPICKLAEMEEAFILTRPRRMGKSTLVSTLEYLFSKGTVGTEGLACHELWNDPYRYFVMHLDWSLYKNDTPEVFVDHFAYDLKSYAQLFDISIDPQAPLYSLIKTVVTGIVSRLGDNTFLEQHPELSQGDRPLSPLFSLIKTVVTGIVSRIGGKTFLEQHPELSQGDRPLCTDKIVLLIDEYDAPLSRNLENEKSFEDLREVYREIFSTLKALSCFRFVFITGITSYAQDSIFSGANQFVDISLLDDYATCCGYTHEDLERYMQPELEHAQEVLKLSHYELMDRLTYHYNGYLFSRDNDEAKRVFSPVSVSSFLYEPEYGFQAYWSETGGASPFVYKMLKLCNKEVTKALLKQLLPQTENSELQQDASLLEDYISEWFPILTSASVSQNLDTNEAVLLTSNVDSLVMKIDESKELSLKDAIAILYQAGYLSIKQVKGSTAYLGIANHDVLFSFCSLIVEQLSLTATYASMTKLLKKLHRNYSHAMTSLQNGGKELASLINEILNTAQRELFAKGNYENVVTFVISLALHYATIPANREVDFLSGRADLVIYKPETLVLTPDVVIEFKLARESESVNNKLMEGCNQIIDRKYGICLENPNPKRYCIVISNELRGVGAIASVNADAEISIDYKSDRLDDQGKVKVQNQKQDSKA